MCQFLVSNVQRNRMSAVVMQSIPVNVGNNDGLLRHASNSIKTSKEICFSCSVLSYVQSIM